MLQRGPHMGLLYSPTKQGETTGPGRAAKLPSSPQQSPQNRISCPSGCAKDFICLSEEQASFDSASRHPGTRALESTSSRSRTKLGSLSAGYPLPGGSPVGKVCPQVPGSLTHSPSWPALLHWVPTPIHFFGFLPTNPFRMQPQMCCIRKPTLSLPSGPPQPSAICPVHQVPLMIDFTISPAHRRAPGGTMTSSSLHSQRLFGKCW